MLQSIRFKHFTVESSLGYPFLLFVLLYFPKSIPRASLVAPMVKNLPAVRETWVQSLGWEDPLEKERLPTPVFWPGEFQELYSPWGRKVSGTTEQISHSMWDRSSPTRD